MIAVKRGVGGHYHLVVNNFQFDFGDASIYPTNKSKSRLEVTVTNPEITDAITKHTFRNIHLPIVLMRLPPSTSILGITGVVELFELDRKKNRPEEFNLSVGFYFKYDEWKQLWSISEYLEAMGSVAQQNPSLVFKRESAPMYYFKLPNEHSSGFSLSIPILQPEKIINSETSALSAMAVKYHELAVTSLLEANRQSNVETIIRSIEFPPEYYQCGITILSYFADVLRHKNLSEQVKVSIEQSGLKVRLIIESPTGQRELIERTLEAYALVVTGKEPIETLTTDPYEIIELKNQLRIASVQIENQREMLALKNSEVTYLKTEFEDTKASLKRLEQRSDDDRAHLMSLIEGLIEKNTDLSSGFKELAQQAVKFQNRKLADALESLHKMVERGVEKEDQKEAIKNLLIIQQEDAGIFRQVGEIVKGAISGAAGNYLYTWLQFIVSSLPK